MRPPAPARDPDDPRGRIQPYRALLFCSLVLLLSLGLVSYLWMMGALYEEGGVVKVRLRSEPEWKAAAAARISLASARRTAWVLELEANRRCARRAGFDLARATRAWRQLLVRAGFRVEAGDDTDLRRIPKRVDLVVAPWTLCLEAATEVRLEGYLRKGGGLVVAGPFTGPRALARRRTREDVQPGGRLLRALGASRLAHVASERWPFVLAAGRTPASAALDPGQRLPMPTSRSAWATDARTPALVWSDWSLRPRVLANGRWACALALARAGQGRLVWTGFPASHAAASGPALVGTLELAARWAAGDSVVAVAPWPGATRAALLVAVDVEHQPENAVGLAALFGRNGIRPTFFLFADRAAARPWLVRRLAAAGEIAAHGDTPAELGGRPLASQRRRLARARERLELASGRAVRGLHPPLERADSRTWSAAAQARFAYALGDPAFDRAYPRVLDEDGTRADALVLLSRAGAGDDYAHLEGRRTNLARARATPFLEDLARIRRLGGLYVFNLRTHLLGHPAAHRVVERVLQAAARPGTWVASAAEIARWARARRALRLELDPKRGGLRVLNTGRRPIEGAVLEIYDVGLEPRALQLSRLEPGGSTWVALGASGLAAAEAPR